MNLRDQLELLRRRWLSVLATFLVVCCLGLLYTVLQRPVYSASTQLFVSVEGATSAQDLNQAGVYTQQIVKSYAQLASTPIVLNPVRQRLNIQISERDLADAVAADAPIDTSVLRVTVTLSTAESAAQAANEIGQQLSSVVQTVSSSGGGSDSVKITTVEPASVPLAPSEPNILRNILLTLIAGIVLAIAAAHIRELLDVRVHRDADVREVTTVPILGAVESDPETKTTPLMRDRDFSPRNAEAYRSLRTTLEFLDGAPSQMVVSSAVPGEGKSTTAANLALSLADAGRRVLLVDGEMRRPALAALFGVDDAFGLSAVLKGAMGWRDAIRRVAPNGLDLLPAGPIPSNPTELLQSSALQALLAEMQGQYDVVIIDAPPLLSFADAGILAKRTAGAIVVCAAGSTSRPQLKAALAKVSGLNARVLGVVLTKTAPDRRLVPSY